MAFRNKSGEMTGISNQTAGEHGFPSSGSMNQAKGLTPQRQMQQAPAAHSAGQRRTEGQSWMEQPNAINRGMQTQGAFAQMVPTKLSSGAASFLVADANMKQAGAQSSGVMNRLEQLEKQQAAPLGFKNQQVIDPKLQSLIAAYMKRDQGDEFSGIQGAGDFAYQKSGGAPTPGTPTPKPFGGSQPPPKPAPDTGGAAGPAAPGYAPSGEAGSAQPAMSQTGSAAPEPDQKSSPYETAPAEQQEKKNADLAGVDVNIWKNMSPEEQQKMISEGLRHSAAAKASGVSEPQKSTGIPEVDEAKGILRDALKRVEEGGELDQALMFQAKQMVQAQEASLQNVLAVQGGGGGAASLSPEMAAQQYKGAKALVSAKAQFEQIRLATEMSVAKTIGNIGLAETQLKQKNMLMAMQMLIENDYAMDPETMKYMIGVGSGEEGYTMDGLTKKLQEKPQPGSDSDWKKDLEEATGFDITGGDDELGVLDVVTAPVRAISKFGDWLFS